MTPSPLAAAAEATVSAYRGLSEADDTGNPDRWTEASRNLDACIDRLENALTAALQPNELLGRALCGAAGIDPDDVISDAGHVAWQLVAHDALRGMVPAELRDAAWRTRAEAAIEVAEAVWAVDVAWMAYEPSDDPNAGPNASQKRHTAAVARLNAARRRYEETCRAG